MIGGNPVIIVVSCRHQSCAQRADSLSLSLSLSSLSLSPSVAVYVSRECVCVVSVVINQPTVHRIIVISLRSYCIHRLCIM